MPKLLRVILLSFVSLLIGRTYAIGQSYIYSDKEMSFDSDKDQMRLMKAANGAFHVWHWGAGKITMEAYNAQLQHQYKKVVSSRSSQIMFIPFDNFYYALIIEAQKSSIYKVEGDSIVDKTATFNEIPVLANASIYLQPGKNKLYILQYHPIDSTNQSQIQITAVDSGLNYMQAISIRTNYNARQLRTLKIFCPNDDLILANTKTDDLSTRLIVHKVNMDSSTVISNAFEIEDKTFHPAELRGFGRNYLLQGVASSPLFSSRRQTSYTYLLTMDDSLKSINHYYTGVADSTIDPNFYYSYYPVSTTILPNYQVLTIDYCNVINTKKKMYGTQIRYRQLDANLRDIKNFELPTIDYSNFPGFLFAMPGQMNVYYEEQIRENIIVIHNCQLGDTLENDRILQLRPKNKYILKRAMPISNNYFIMPYVRNYRLGLVKVKVADGED